MILGNIQNAFISYSYPVPVDLHFLGQNFDVFPIRIST